VWRTRPLPGGFIRRPRVALYKAEGCHLCERAKAELAGLREELGFELVEIAIDGDAELESRYRELIPVVEIDGERVCTYYVQPEPFRRKLAVAQAAAETGHL
jgi:glutaredoxin